MPKKQIAMKQNATRIQIKQRKMMENEEDKTPNRKQVETAHFKESNKQTNEESKQHEMQ